MNMPAHYSFAGMPAKQKGLDKLLAVFLQQ
jgi:hypothetical protein